MPKRKRTPEQLAKLNEYNRLKRKNMTREEKDKANASARARYHKRAAKRREELDKAIERRKQAKSWLAENFGDIPKVPQSRAEPKRKRPKLRQPQKRFVYPELLPYGHPCGIVYMVDVQVKRGPKVIKPEDYVGICRDPNAPETAKQVTASRVHAPDWDA